MDYTYTIKQDNTAYGKGTWYCVLKNPFITITRITKYITGGSAEIVERKIQRQLKKWEKSKDKDNARILQNIENFEKRLEENKNNDDLPF